MIVVLLMTTVEALYVAVAKKTVLMMLQSVFAKQYRLLRVFHLSAGFKIVMDVYSLILSTPTRSYLKIANF